MRFAFLTPEYVSPATKAGGLANFVERITRCLMYAGHEVDLYSIAPNGQTQKSIEQLQEGCRRLLLPIPPPSAREQFLLNLSSWNPVTNLTSPSQFRRAGKGLCAWIETEHDTRPYDVAHTADYGGLGCYFSTQRSFKLVCRSSSITEKCRALMGLHITLAHHLFTADELATLRAADVCYAPSTATANYYQQVHRIPMNVLRPPFFLEVAPQSDMLPTLPSRYLAFVGNVCHFKGTDLIAQALPQVWQQEPEFCMVWAGKELRPGTITRFQKQWGSRTTQVHWLGQQSKTSIYHLLKNAAATVAPSRVDNLPNVVLESLALGTPVIGSYDAHMQEMITPGLQGHLVSTQDLQSLVAVMLAAWRGESPYDGTPLVRPAIFDQMQPDVAIQNFINLINVPESQLENVSACSPSAQEHCKR